MSASIGALNPPTAAWIGSAPAGHAGRVGGVGGAHGTEVAKRRAQRLSSRAGPARCDLELEKAAEPGTIWSQMNQPLEQLSCVWFLEFGRPHERLRSSMLEFKGQVTCPDFLHFSGCSSSRTPANWRQCRFKHG
jgi:hypothetical protein